MVRFLLATAAAFLMFLRAAVRCFVVAMHSPFVHLDSVIPDFDHPYDAYCC
jgi:hypothetical protein